MVKIILFRSNSLYLIAEDTWASTAEEYISYRSHRPFIYGLEASVNKKGFRATGPMLKSTSRSYKNTKEPPSSSKLSVRVHKASNFLPYGTSTVFLPTTKTPNILVYLQKAKHLSQEAWENTMSDKLKSQVRLNYSFILILIKVWVFFNFRTLEGWIFWWVRIPMLSRCM